MATAAVINNSHSFNKDNMRDRDIKRDAGLKKKVEVMEVDKDVEEEDFIMTETSVLEKGKKLQEAGRANELAQLIVKTRPFLTELSKAKAAKLVRALVDLFLDMNASTGLEVQLCKECIEWAKTEKRTFLRQALTARLIALYFTQSCYTEALEYGSTLLKELKKMDDKNLLVEVQLLESKTYHALSNLPRARAALTSARTTANSIYCPPKLQASLDQQSGVLHAADEKDFKTAYSYFYEAFEGYDSIDDQKALISLKYMLLCKIMLKLPDDVQSIVSGKLALKYSGKETDAMIAVAQAAHNRSLADFRKALSTYKHELEEDRIIAAHLDSLYDNMLEQNLQRVIEPYSRIQVDYVASTIKLKKDIIEKKLSQMILDKKLIGILDQGAGSLILFGDQSADKTYQSTLDTVSAMGKVVDTLYKKAKKIT